MTSVTDLEVCQRLLAAAAEFDDLQAHSATLVGSAALNTASRTLRGMAQAVFETTLAAADPKPQ